MQKYWPYKESWQYDNKKYDNKKIEKITEEQNNILNVQSEIIKSMLQIINIKNGDNYELKTKIRELNYTQAGIKTGLELMGHNVTQSYLSKLVNGVPENPKYELKKALSLLLDCEIKDIFWDIIKWINLTVVL